MATVHLKLHTRPVREDDAVSQWPSDNDPDAIAKAADAFRVFLSSLMPKPCTPKRFIVRGYAAMWCLDPAAFGGKTQLELANELGVNPQHFNRLAQRWAGMFGFVGGKMKPRAKTLAAARTGAKKGWVMGG